jgi:UDP-N-acetylglucosamine:LPS N-acetylglucosamine transferase
LPEKDLTSDSLVESVTALLGDPARRQAMAHAAKSLAHPNAARDVAALAARLASD